VTALNAGFDDAGVGIAVTVASNRLTFTSEEGADAATAGITISSVAASATPVVAASLGFASQTTTLTEDIGAKSVDQLVTAINANTDLQGKVRASNDNGKLRIENQSTSTLTVTGVTSGTADGETGTSTIGGNDVRKNLVKQFNELRDQLDKFADDASFNGINLLRGDKLKLTFNETGTSTIEIQAKDETGTATSINNTALGIETAVDADFDADTTIDAKLSTLGDALNSLRSQSSTFGSNLSVVENRQDFTKNMINTLETGAANLTLADTNEEAANLLALQTRQQLSSTALSMASQADQAVLRLF
jgi:flagellin